MNELHTKILEYCLNEIKTRLKQKKRTVFTESEIDMLVGRSGSYVKEAALLAMEKQAEFFRWASSQHWEFRKSFGKWYQARTDSMIDELELFEIWKGQK